MHLVTGAIAGVILAIIISNIRKLKIIDFNKGIIEGVVYSINIFVVLYIPTTMSMVQPNLFDILNHYTPAQGKLEEEQKIEHNLTRYTGLNLLYISSLEQY